MQLILGGVNPTMAELVHALIELGLHEGLGCSEFAEVVVFVNWSIAVVARARLIIGKKRRGD